MLSYTLLYIAETIAFVIAIIVGIIKHKNGNKHGLVKFIILAFFIYVAIFLITFIFEKPQMDLKKVENIEVMSELNIENPKTFYHFQDVTNKVIIKNDADLTKIGQYKVQFEIKTLVGKYVKEDTINVVDTTAPEIKLNGEEDYKQSYSKEYEEPGYEVKDAYEGEIKDNIEINKKEINENEYEIEYIAKDSSGNESKKTRHITIVDDVPPIITINGKSRIYIAVNSEYKEPGAKAVDEKDGDVSESLKIEGTVDTAKEGEYTIHYKASDSKGNEGTATRKVIVSTPEQTQEQISKQAEEGIIYLTFDDGPTTTSTPKILDILNQKGVKATFFILNYDEEGEKLVKREHNEGHTVAIHGYSHKYEEIYTSVDAYMNNLTRLQDKIRNSTGFTATATRFPGGSSNTISKKYSLGIMTKLCAEVVSRGFTYFDWNVDSNDAGSAKTANDVYNNVVNGLKHTRSNVVLMHDFANNNKTINALANIIDYGKANGYTFKAITKDTRMVTHTPNN